MSLPTARCRHRHQGDRLGLQRDPQGVRAVGDLHAGRAERRQHDLANGLRPEGSCFGVRFGDKPDGVLGAAREGRFHGLRSGKAAPAQGRRRLRILPACRGVSVPPGEAGVNAAVCRDARGAGPQDTGRLGDGVMAGVQRKHARGVQEPTSRAAPIGPRRRISSRWLVRLPSPASSPHATVGPIQGSPNCWPWSIGRSNAAVDNRPGDVDRPHDCGIAVSGGWVRTKVRRVPKAIRRKARTKTRAVETRPVEAGPAKTHAAEPEPLSTG